MSPDSEFEQAFAELLSSVGETEVTKVEDPGESPCVVEPPVLNMETVTEPEQVVVKPTSKPDAKRYATVDGKVPVSNGPCTTTVYPRGYCQFKWQQSWNKCALREPQILELKEFFCDEARFNEWLEEARAAGLK